MGKPVSPQGEPGDVAYDRLRAEIKSLRREMGTSVGNDFDPVTLDAGERPR